jgi:hypothetical protein
VGFEQSGKSLRFGRELWSNAIREMRSCIYQKPINKGKDFPLDHLFTI